MDEPSSTESNAITLRIKFKSASLDEFISRYGADVSPGGLFIRTKQPLDVGTSLQFEFTLADGGGLLAGLGTVAWVRENDPARANNIPGMGLRFDKLTPESQHTHQLILAEKARKEGKSVGTPYPPTTFVAPAARPTPDLEGSRPAFPVAAKPEAFKAEPRLERKSEPSAANFSVTRPAPATAVPPPSAVPIAAAPEITDEFSSGGKTVINDMPMDFEAMAADAGQSPAVRTNAEEAAPAAMLDDWRTDASPLPVTKNEAAPPELLKEGAAGAGEAEKSAPMTWPTPERKTSSGERLAALLDLGAASESGPEKSVPNEILEEISAGAPIDEPLLEKAVDGPATPKPARASSSAFDMSEVSLGPGATSEGLPRRPGPKGSSKVIFAVAALAAAAAFGAVYLAKTKPWQQQKPAEATLTAKPEPAEPAAVPAPAAQPAAPAPGPTKPTVAAEPAAKKANEKATEKANERAGEKAGEESKPAVVAVEEKAAGDKPAGAKEAESGTPSVKHSGKGGGSKTGSKSAEGRWGNELGTEAEQAFRLLFRSVPSGSEVLIDGQYFGRTPCERRILDINKSYTIEVRREGYESHERTIDASDNWVKKGNERVLTVMAKLKKGTRSTAGSEMPVPTATSPTLTPAEPKVDKKPEAIVPPPPSAKPEVKPEAPKAESKSEATKLEPPKPESKPAPAPAAEKTGPFKPVPNFDEPSK
jgi:uncharacterized protein (TIGR02266 family)